MRRFAALLVVVLATGVASGSAFALGQPQTFSLLDVTLVQHPINGFAFNRAPRGGDQFAFTDGLYKWAGKHKGARVGRLEGLCTFLYQAGSRFVGFCTGQAFLPGGSVLAQGTATFAEGPSRFDLPVVGGTGSYANVRGFIHIRDLGNGNSDNSNIDLHLIP